MGSVGVEMVISPEPLMIVEPVALLKVMFKVLKVTVERL